MAIAHVWPSHAIVRYDDLWLLTLEGTDGLRWTRCVNSDCPPALGCRRCRAAMERPRSLRRYFSSFPPDAASVHMLATRMNVPVSAHADDLAAPSLLLLQ